VLSALTAAKNRLNGEESEKLVALLTDYESRQRSAERFVAAYRNYCWPAESISDFKLAPFHLLATEQGAHVQRDHRWHMQTLAKICEEDNSLLLATPYRLVDVTDPGDIQTAAAWWTELTESGGEGLVIKPLEFTASGKRGLVQPAIKCRGREYLRIIYGPDYTDHENLTRLRDRGLAAKRSLALREFALGIEALERFIRKEPLRRVHECVLGVLALESEPVDPRL
jgi:protein phosphatase